ncbi:MAG: hypothetical protein ACJ8GN_12250 [Longimicrobiaceae bacterium]
MYSPAASWGRGTALKRRAHVTRNPLTLFQMPRQGTAVTAVNNRGSFFVGMIWSNILFHVQSHTTPLDSDADDFSRFVATIPLYIPLAVQAVYAVLLWYYVKHEREKLWIRIAVRTIYIAVGLVSMGMAFIFGGWSAFLLTAFGLVVAISAGVLVLAAIRVSIRRAYSAQVPVSRALYLLGCLFLGSALMVFALNSHFLHPAHQRSEMLSHFFTAARFILMINGTSLMIIGTLLLGSFLLLIYRLTWPTLSRVTYFIPGDRLVFNSRLLLTFATALLGLAFSSLVIPTARPNNTVRPDNTVCWSATFYGTVTTNGTPTDAWFEWGTTTNFGRTTAHQVFNKNTSYRQTVINLDGGTTYYWRGVAVNHRGKALGMVRTFTIPAQPYGVEIAC